MNLTMRIVRSSIFVSLLLLSALISGCSTMGSGLKSDESVLFFPSYGAPAADGGWRLNIHGWVFEPEKDDALRNMFVQSVAAHAEIPQQGPERERFEERMRWFLVDNERGKVLRVDVGGQTFPLQPTGPNGHTVTQLTTTDCPLPGRGDGDCAGWTEFRLASEHGRSTTGRLRLVPGEGVSVISDIDDTIKISHVTDTEQMLRTAFLEEYRPVPGMSELYRRWESEGAVFQYLSASPWHLYPTLSEFTDASGFPQGVFHLMAYRLKDRTLLDLFRSPYEKKQASLVRLVNSFPKRRFVLVGDSGQADPEVYGDLACVHPSQVRAVYIRAVEGSDLSEERLNRAFRCLDKERGRLFRDSVEIQISVDSF